MHHPPQILGCQTKQHVARWQGLPSQVRAKGCCNTKMIKHVLQQRHQLWRLLLQQAFPDVKPTSHQTKHTTYGVCQQLCKEKGVRKNQFMAGDGPINYPKPTRLRLGVKWERSRMQRVQSERQLCLSQSGHGQCHTSIAETRPVGQETPPRWPNTQKGLESRAWQYPAVCTFRRMTWSYCHGIRSVLRLRAPVVWFV